MANVHLDAVIRKLAKQQQRILTDAVKKHRDRAMALATKIKSHDAKQRQRKLAKDMFKIGTATIKRLQMSADNAADSHARSIRQIAEESEAVAAKVPTKKAKSGKATKKVTKKTKA